MFDDSINNEIKMVNDFIDRYEGSIIWYKGTLPPIKKINIVSITKALIYEKDWQQTNI